MNKTSSTTSVAAENWFSGSVQDYGTKGPEFESRHGNIPLRGVDYLLEHPDTGHFAYNSIWENSLLL